MHNESRHRTKRPDHVDFTEKRTMTGVPTRVTPTSVKKEMARGSDE